VPTPPSLSFDAATEELNGQGVFSDKDGYDSFTLGGSFDLGRFGKICGEK